MLEKLDHIHSKLRYRIEELEKLQANHSKQLDNHSEELDHLSKEHTHHSEQLEHLSKQGEHQNKRLRRHSDELACLNKKSRTEDEEKVYSEFSNKKGINLCRLKHLIIYANIYEVLVLQAVQKK